MFESMSQIYLFFFIEFLVQIGAPVSMHPSLALMNLLSFAPRFSTPPPPSCTSLLRGRDQLRSLGKTHVTTLEATPNQTFHVQDNKTFKKEVCLGFKKKSEVHFYFPPLGSPF